MKSITDNVNSSSNTSSGMSAGDDERVKNVTDESLNTRSTNPYSNDNQGKRVKVVGDFSVKRVRVLKSEYKSISRRYAKDVSTNGSSD